VTAVVGGVGTPASFSLINDTSFPIVGVAAGPFSPGITQSINLTVTNPYNFSIDVSGITTTVLNGTTIGNTSTANLNCSGTTNMVVTHAFSGSVDIPADTTVTLTGGAGYQLPQVQMPDLTTNQDGCKSTTFHFTFSGSATTP
jgi:hypothetical protein